MSRSFVYFIFFLSSSCVTSHYNHKDQISDIPSFEGEHLYLEGKSQLGFILCHGGGAYPDWKVVGSLRRSLNSALGGAHTLSLQMPTSSGKWTNYLDTFPAAMKTIKHGVAFLQSKGINKIVLVGHSMGARMASYFLAHQETHGVDLFVGLGMRNNGGEGLNVLSNMRHINIPILDIYGTSSKNTDFQDGQHRKN